MMDATELVRLVVKEVLERLARAQRRPAIKILHPREAALESRLRSCLDADCDLLFSGETREAAEPGRYILPFLCCSGLADLALGRASDALAQEVLRLLLRGQTVEVMEFEYERYHDTAPGPLYARYVAYRKTLAGYGLVDFREKQPDAVIFRGALVTERDVLSAADNGASALHIPATAQVTPLAADAAQERGMVILKRL
jgi:hypothetical protein